MIDLDHCYLWAWDSRPFPDFPGNSELWSDYANYDKGHWLNGRATSQSVASIVLDIFEPTGIYEFVDVDELFGDETTQATYRFNKLYELPLLLKVAADFEVSIDAPTASDPRRRFL